MKIIRNNNGFSALVLVLIMAVVFVIGGAGWYLSGRDGGVFSVIPGLSSEEATVEAINNDQAAYAGKRIKVEGKIFIDPGAYVGEAPCEIDASSSDDQRSCGDKLEPKVYLSALGSKAPGDIAPPIQIYKDGKPWPCSYTSFTDVDCGKFKNESDMTVVGKFVQVSTPYQGASTPSGDYEVISYRYTYYLEVD